MMKRTLIGLCTGALALTLACGKSGPPVSPSSANDASAAAAADGSTLKIGAPTLTAPATGFQGAIGTSDPVTLVLSNVTGTYATFAVTYEFEVRNPAGTVVQNPKVAAGAGTTQTTIQVSSLLSDTVYTWRARATYDTAFGPWSATRTFRTPVPEGIFGQLVLDNLTGGKTFGKQRGGQFILGQGWQATSRTDGIDYDIPTCTNCKVEFDMTNFGLMEGQCCNADLKFFSMASAGDFNSFGAFRDSPWKMHFIQRADNDGLEIIWRNGGTDPEGNPGDHRIKQNCCGPPFKNSSVFHFVIQWTPAGHKISIGTNGATPIEYMSDGFGGIAYAPPNHRLSLGCYPRGETMLGAIYRNFKVTPGAGGS